MPGLAKIMSWLNVDGDESFEHAGTTLEFTLEWLSLMHRFSKNSAHGTSVYRT